jgi:alpha-beta hydrolase superfamily lysophospholipase
MKKATTTTSAVSHVHGALDAAFAYGDHIAALRTQFAKQTKEAIRAALLPEVASYPKYNVPLVKGDDQSKAKGQMVLDAEHPQYEACRKALGRLVKEIVGEVSGHKEKADVKVPTALVDSTIDAVIAAGLDKKQLAAFLAAVKAGIQY